MTPFALMASLAGISHREAAEICGVRLDTVRSWASGRNRTPSGALDDLRRLVERQERAAAQAIAQIAALASAHGAPEEIEIGYPADDHEAGELGFSCLGAWRGMAARVIAATSVKVVLVPRGATPTTARAADEHSKAIGLHTTKRGP